MSRAWNNHVGFTFCEGTWSPNPFFGIDELINCLSSCVLLGVGIRGGMRQKMDTFTYLLYGALTVCGMGSFMFHARLIEAFRLADELAILYLVTLGYYVAALDYISHKDESNSGFQYSVIAVSSFIGIAEIDIFTGNLYVFCLLTALLVGGIVYFSVNGNQYLSVFEQNLVKKGQVAGIISAVAWIGDMALCGKTISYFYLHALWHCLIAVTINYFIEIHESQIRRKRKETVSPSFFGPFVFCSSFSA